MNGRSFGGILVALVIAGFVVYSKFQKQDDAGKETLAQAHALVATCEGYANNKPYYDKVCDEAHELAFDHAYKLGGRRSSGRLEEDQYWREFFEIAISHATRARQKPVADDLTKLRDKTAPATAP